MVKCEVYNNWVYASNCIKCDIKIYKEDGERLFCWDCWNELKKRNDVSREEMSTIYRKLVKEFKEIPETQILNLYPGDYKIYYETPLYTMIYKKRVKKTYLL